MLRDAQFSIRSWRDVQHYEYKQAEDDIRQHVMELETLYEQWQSISCQRDRAKAGRIV
jgi:hypothetical protein